MEKIINKEVGMGILILGLVITLVVLFLNNSTGNAVYSENNYEIGVVTSLTGKGSTLGKPMVEGMQLAVDEINLNGGINGRKIELYIEDGKLEGGPTNMATQFIINNHDVDGMVTLYHIDAEVISPLTKNKDIPLLHASFARSLLEEDSNAYKINFDAEEGCKKLIEYAKENQKYQKLGVLMSRTAYNEYCLKGAKEIENEISEYWYDWGETDYRTLLLKAQNDGVDSLLTVGIDFEYVEMFGQISELGYDINLICATASECINPKLAENDYDSFEGTLSVDFVNPEEISKSDFARRYSSAFNNNDGVVVTYAGIGYDSVMIFKNVFENCEPGDKECIHNGLKNYQNSKRDSVIGTIGFEERVLKLEYDLFEFKGEEWGKI